MGICAAEARASEVKNWDGQYRTGSDCRDRGHAQDSASRGQGSGMGLCR